MRILVVGASGTIGQAVVERLSDRHDIIRAGRSGADVQVDITSEESIRAMYEAVGSVDAVISATGGAHFGPLTDLTPELNQIGIDSKLKGQVNLVLLGLESVRDGGSFTLTTGIMMDDPIRQGASAALANGGVKAFVHAAAIEMPRGIRINSVSPNVLIESLEKSVEGAQTGQNYEVY